MNFIYPKVELIDEQDNFKRIERCARKCYQSDARITSSSAYPFFQRMCKNGHTSTLEHSIVYVRTHTANTCAKLKQVLIEYIEDKGYPHYIRYSRYNNDYNVFDPIDLEYNTGLHLGSVIGEEWLFSGNIRAWRDICEIYKNEPILHDIFYNHAAFVDIFDRESECETKDLFYSPNEIEVVNSIETNPACFPDAYKHIIVSFDITADRGIIDEYCRQRICGISVESTRYCNYSDNGLTFVFPYWYEHDKLREDRLNSQMSSEFVNRCYDTELAYQEWMKKTNTPQSARGNLILWTKSEGAFTATIQQWIDILALRDSPAAHPDARKIAKMIEKVLVEQVGVKDIWGVAENGD